QFLAREVEGGEGAVAAEGVDGLAVGGRRRGGRVALVGAARLDGLAEVAFPQFLARRADAHQDEVALHVAPAALAGRGGGVGVGAGEKIFVATEGGRGAATTGGVEFPHTPLFFGPLRGPPFLRATAVVGRPPPLRPVGLGGAGRRCEGERKQKIGQGHGG